MQFTARDRSHLKKVDSVLGLAMAIIVVVSVFANPESQYRLTILLNNNKVATNARS